MSDFVSRWHDSSGAERANYQQFFTEFCQFLGVAPPDPQQRDTYCFEKPVKVLRGDGSASPQRIDFYKQGHFIFEAKQGSQAAGQGGMARRGTAGWQKAMRAAFVQAVGYAHHLQERPPFLITCDIGHVFEVWTGFSRPYGDYNARQFQKAPLGEVQQILTGLGQLGVLIQDGGGGRCGRLLRGAWRRLVVTRPGSG